MEIPDIQRIVREAVAEYAMLAEGRPVNEGALRGAIDRAEFDLLKIHVARIERALADHGIDIADPK